MPISSLFCATFDSRLCSESLGLLLNCEAANDKPILLLLFVVPDAPNLSSPDFLFLVSPLFFVSDRPLDPPPLLGIRFSNGLPCNSCANFDRSSIKKVSTKLSLVKRSCFSNLPVSGRWLPSILRHSCKKSRQSRFQSGNIWCRLVFCSCFIPLNMELRVTNSWWRAFSLPTTRMIWNSWSMSDSPGNNGSPVIISAYRQPTAQMSTSLPYRGSPASSSGERYHLQTEIWDKRNKC